MYNFLAFAAFYVVANVIIAYALKYFSEEFNVHFDWNSWIIGVKRWDVQAYYDSTWTVHPFPFVYYTFILR